MAANTGKRIPQPSRQRLEEADDLAGSKLLTLISSASDVLKLEDTSAIKQFIVDIKAAIKPFEAASRALSAYLTSYGSYTEASEVRSRRLQLVHQDCKELLRNLNSELTDRNEEAASSICGPSTIAHSFHPLQAAPHSLHQSVPLPVSEVNTSMSQLSIHDQPACIPAPAAQLNFSPGNLTRSLIQPTQPQEVLAGIPQDNVARFVDEQAQQQHMLAPDVDRLDPISRRQLKQDLLRGVGTPFSGDPEKYWCWQQQLSRRILECEAGYLDSLHIIEANTAGRPKKMVTDFITAGAHEPKITLGKIWKALRSRFGNSHMVTDAILLKLESIPSIKNVSRVKEMEDLLDMCRIIESAMSHCIDLTAFDLPRGAQRVWSKMPEQFQHKWNRFSHRQEERTCSPPKFKEFVEFLDNYVAEISSPHFQACLFPSSKPQSTKTVKALVTETERLCSYHGKPGHTIEDCKAFKRLNFREKKQFATDHKLCFACLGEHRVSDCPGNISCNICNGKHAEAMHRNNRPSDFQSNQEAGISQSSRENFSSNSDSNSFNAKTNCLEVCLDAARPKICSKTVLVDVMHCNNQKRLKCLAIIDEQSNTTFCDPKLIDFFSIKNSKNQSYSLTTMSGLKTSYNGSIVEGLKVKGVKEKRWIELPSTVTNPNIPNSAHEAASPRIVASHSHISKYAHNFATIDENAEVLLLIGADCGEAMFSQSYGHHHPYVHKTPLGWSLVGPICRKNDQNASDFRCFRTSSTFDCEHFSLNPVFDKPLSPALGSSQSYDTSIEYPDDDAPGLSRNDEEFINLMETSITVNDEGKLELPLPLKKNMPLKFNKSAVFARSRNTLTRLKKDPERLRQSVEVMGKYLNENHVEQVPQGELSTNNITYHIPVFPVVHPQKRKLRIVFDSSAAYQGVCLNDCLLQGPDFNNKIVGVLTRFRHGKIGFAADIHCMFHCFSLPPKHRDLLRFFWWKDNNPDSDLVEFRSRVHNFGNSSSPAVANFALRYTTQDKESQTHPEACRLIKENFYVDDCLGSRDSDEEAIALLKDAINILDRYSIKLHKVTSSSLAVRQAFHDENNHEIDIGKSSVTKTLGVSWCTSSDKLIVKCQFPEKQITKRGVLSTLHSLYDPLGMVSPVVLAGKLLQRQMFPPKGQCDILSTIGWDDEIPREKSYPWVQWLSSLEETEDIAIARCFVPRVLRC